LGALALPLALAIVLHLISPRGSREGLTSRMSHTGQGGLVVLLVIMLVASAALVGMMAGPWFCLPFVVGLLAVGLPGAAGSRWQLLVLPALRVGRRPAVVCLGPVWPRLAAPPPRFPAVSWESTRTVWHESFSIFKQFPWVGTGLGSFGTIHPYAKAHDAAY